MNKGSYPYSLAKKITVTVVVALACLVSIGCMMLTAYFGAAGFFSQAGWSYDDSSACSHLNYLNASELAYNYYPYAYQYKALQKQQEALAQTGLESDRNSTAMQALYGSVHSEEVAFRPEKTNFRFTILRGENEVFYTTYSGEPYSSYETYHFTVNNPELGYDETIFVDCYVVSPMSVEDDYYKDSVRFTALYHSRMVVVAILAASLVVLIAGVSYLMLAAGHVWKDGKDTIAQGGLHLIPFDLLSLMIVALCFILYAIMKRVEVTGVTVFNIALSSTNLIFSIINTDFFYTFIFMILVFYFMSLNIRLRKNNLLSDLLLVQLFRFISRNIRAVYVEWPLNRRAVTWVIVILAAVLVLGIFLVKPNWYWLFVVISLVTAFLVMILLNGYQRQYKALGTVLHRMADGDLDARADPDYFRGFLKDEAVDLNRMSVAVQNAVDERTKSERMKTDLITNVSHDIKTPLTSIINYVDLLRKGTGYTQDQLHYLDVLSQQSTRLKKLIEDLIEASKASSGSIKADIVCLDVNEFIEQVAGEYRDRLSKADLELVAASSEEACLAMADGQLLYRVLDNLLSNALKYSQKGTRVYLDALFTKAPKWAGETASPQGVLITVRNISSYPLHLSGDELMERFVRGDTSRHTEGSGLGLSIAKSLTNIMGGQFQIEIDGDLFKALIYLPEGQSGAGQAEEAMEEMEAEAGEEIESTEKSEVAEKLAADDSAAAGESNKLE